MRRWISIVAVLVLVAAATWAWPLAGAIQLGRTAQSGNSGDVVDRVDLPALRRSLARQIAIAYLRVTGKAQKLGAFGQSVAGAAATTVADPYVDELLTPENITALLTQGRINRVTVGGRSVALPGGRTIPDLPKMLNGDLLSIVTGSYFAGLNDFVIPVNGGGGSGDEYGIHMRRTGLTWKLGGLDLPASILDEMAQSIVGQEKPPTP